MGESLEMRLEVVPGKINAVWASHSAKEGRDGYVQTVEDNAGIQQEQRAADVQIQLDIPVWSPSEKRGMIRRLAAHAEASYALLQGRVLSEALVEPLLPTAAELEPGAGSLHDARKAELLQQLRQRLVMEPSLAFTMRGISQAELLDGVFALWAEADRDEPDGALSKAGALASELARLERKGPPISSGEWLAEAAAEGSLHQPGTLFHEIAERSFPAAPVVAEPKEDWQQLLPQAPKARQGLELILRRVSEAAIKRAERRKP